MINKLSTPGDQQTPDLFRLFMYLLLIACLSCSPATYISTETHVQFRTIGRIPIMEGKLNGKRAFFIVDTGASISLLNEAKASYFGYGSYPESDRTVVGFAGESKMNVAYNCQVEFGPVIITGVTFRSRHMQDFAAVIQQHESVEIAGIIGSDVLRRYNININYGANTISFEHRKPQRSLGTSQYEVGFAKLPGQLF